MSSQVAGNATAPRWAGWCLIAGGVAMTGLWVVFTLSHGPTSYNENHPILGRGMYFWGLLLGVVPNVLIVLGLVGLRRPLVAGVRRGIMAAYVIAIACLVASAGVDFAFGALGPPLLMPVLALSLLAFAALPDRTDPRQLPGLRSAVLPIAVLLIAAFVFALIPLEISDRFDGYRVFGVFAYVGPGLAWARVGLLALRSRGSVPA